MLRFMAFLFALAFVLLMSGWAGGALGAFVLAVLMPFAYTTWALLLRSDEA